MLELGFRVLKDINKTWISVKTPGDQKVAAHCDRAVSQCIKSLNVQIHFCLVPEF